jgi:hypothetical protein
MGLAHKLTVVLLYSLLRLMIRNAAVLLDSATLYVLSFYSFGFGILPRFSANTNSSLSQEYFTEIAGAVKRVVVVYGPDGKPRGSATVSFHNAAAAAKAVKLADGTKVDNRHVMKASNGQLIRKIHSNWISG